MNHKPNILEQFKSGTSLPLDFVSPRTVCIATAPPRKVRKQNAKMKLKKSCEISLQFKLGLQSSPFYSLM